MANEQAGQSDGHRPSGASSEDPTSKAPDVFISYDRADETAVKAITHLLDDPPNGENAKYLASAAGMVAASAGVAASIASAGSLFAASLIGLAGVSISLVAPIERIVSLRRRRKYKTSADIQDEVLRHLVVEVADEQKRWQDHNVSSDRAKAP